MAGDQFLIHMGQRISQRRKALHMTQEQLAEKIGISLQSVSCIELGKKAVRPGNLAKLCVHLQTTADYVLFGKRDAQQMKPVEAKLAGLSNEEYEAVCLLIDLLSGKEKE